MLALFSKDLKKKKNRKEINTITISENYIYLKVNVKVSNM